MLYCSKCHWLFGQNISVLVKYALLRCSKNVRSEMNQNLTFRLCNPDWQYIQPRNPVCMRCKWRTCIEWAMHQLSELSRLSCYLASSTHTRVGHRYNEYSTRVIAVSKHSHVWAHHTLHTTHPCESARVVQRTPHMYLMICVHLRNTHYHIYIMHYQVHVHNSNMTKPS